MGKGRSVAPGWKGRGGEIPVRGCADLFRDSSEDLLESEPGQAQPRLLRQQPCRGVKHQRWVGCVGVEGIALAELGQDVATRARGEHHAGRDGVLIQSARQFGRDFGGTRSEADHDAPFVSAVDGGCGVEVIRGVNDFAGESPAGCGVRPALRSGLTCRHDTSRVLAHVAVCQFEAPAAAVKRARTFDSAIEFDRLAHAKLIRIGVEVREHFTVVGK